MRRREGVKYHQEQIIHGKVIIKTVSLCQLKIKIILKTESLSVFANTIQNYPAYRKFTLYIKTNTETEI